MNWSKSYSRTSTGSNTEMFAFDSNIRKDSYGGYIRFYYNDNNVWSKDSNFYNMNVKSGNSWFSSAGIETTIFKPIKK